MAACLHHLSLTAEKLFSGTRGFMRIRGPSERIKGVSWRLEVSRFAGKSDPRSVQSTGGGHSPSQRKTKIGKEEKCMSCRISPSAATERTRTGDNNRLCFESGRSIEHVRVSSGIGCLHIRAMKLLQVHKLGETTEADIPSTTTSEVKESCRQHYTLFNVRPANGKCRAPKLTQKN